MLVHVGRINGLVLFTKGDDLIDLLQLMVSTMVISIGSHC
jgi:hypothetical protein